MVWFVCGSERVLAGLIGHADLRTLSGSVTLIALAGYAAILIAVSRK